MRFNKMHERILNMASQKKKNNENNMNTQVINKEVK